MCFNPYSFGMFTLLFDIMLLLLFYGYILDFIDLDYYIRLLLQPEDGT